jgi:hypothetical protein
VDFLKRAAVKDQKSFQGLFSGLLAVVNACIEMSIRQAADLAGGVQVAVRLEQPGAAQFSRRLIPIVFAPVRKFCARGRRSNAGSGQIQTGC